MKQRLQILAVLVIFILPVFLHSFTHLSDEEYKKLSKSERTNYWNALESELSSAQQRRSDANADSEQLTTDIENLRNQLNETNTEIQQLFGALGISEQNIAEIHTKIQYYKDQLTNWERMNDDQLWNNARAFRELREDYDTTYNLRLSRLPEFQRDWNELNRRFTQVGDSIDRIRKTRGYYEDNYTVQSGDTLARISGYDFIYGDPSKWGIIFRANRDQLTSPNNISVGQNLRIPRGLPTSWRVHRGESLWRISQYPEVYGTGTRWPIIYRANRDQIRDPNLIFPNQVFVIPRDDQ
jgi:uncharacterized coiled-coil DUF342 family protein